jgi:hypothetical protein
VVFVVAVLGAIVGSVVNSVVAADSDGLVASRPGGSR